MIGVSDSTQTRPPHKQLGLWTFDWVATVRPAAAVHRAEVKVLACALPATFDVRLSRWTCADLATQVASAGIAPSVSVSTVRRTLAEDAVETLAVPIRSRSRGSTAAQASFPTGAVPPTSSRPAARGAAGQSQIRE